MQVCTFTWTDPMTLAGLHSAHLWRVFMQVNLDRILAKYILRQYTRDAKKDLPFDRMDKKLQGKDGETYRQRHNWLFRSTMKLIGRAILSSFGTDKAEDAMNAAFQIITHAQPDIGFYANEHTQVCETNITSLLYHDLNPVTCTWNHITWWWSSSKTSRHKEWPGGWCIYRIWCGQGCDGSGTSLSRWSKGTDSIYGKTTNLYVNLLVCKTIFKDKFTRT